MTENKPKLVEGVGYQDVDKILTALMEKEAALNFAVEESKIPKRTIIKWAKRHYDGRTWTEEIRRRQDLRTREEHGLSAYEVCDQDFEQCIEEGFSPFIRKDEGQKVKKEIEETGKYREIGKEVALKGLMATDGVFHRYELNVPFLPFNPVKRISLAARAITTAGVWKKPEEPLFPVSSKVPEEEIWKNLASGAIYHDVSTINAKIVFAKTEDDRRLTIDDAIIISKKFADRAEYDYIYTDKASGRFMQWAELFVDSDNKPIPLVNKTLEKGEPLQWVFYDEEETEIYFLEGNVMPVSGDLEVNGEPKKYGRKKERYVQGYRIRVKGKIGVGDKLLGLTGLRGMVAEIREELPGNADIMIHSAKVWGTKGSRKCGAMYLEMQNTDDHLAVFYQPAHLAKNEISQREVTVSTTLWSVLATHGNPETQKLLVSERFADICYMFKLEIDNENILRAVDKPTIDKDNGSIIEARVSFFKNQKVDDIWVPDWLQLEFIKSTALGVSLESTKVQGLLTQTLKSYDPFRDGTRIGQLEYYLQESLINVIRNKKFFETEIVGSTYNVVCVPFLQPISKKKQSNVVYLNPSMGYEDGQRLLIVREPVISKANVQHVRVIHDKDLPHNVIKVDPYIIKQMYGDYDGDRVWILPIDDESFKEKVDDYRKIDDMGELESTINIVEVEEHILELPTYEKKLEEAENYHNDLVESKVIGAGKFGGARKNCDLKINQIENTKKFTLPNAYLLELGIKDRDQEGGDHEYTISEYQKECSKRIRAVEWKDILIVQIYSHRWNNVRSLVGKKVIVEGGLYNIFFDKVIRT